MEKVIYICQWFKKKKIVSHTTVRDVAEIQVKSVTENLILSNYDYVLPNELTNGM